MELYSREWCLPNGASADSIAALRGVAPNQLPDAYFDLLTITNGGEGPLPCQPRWFQLYDAEYVTESILAGRFDDAFPNFFVFGSNGGGEFIAFDLRRTAPFPIVYVDMIAGCESAKTLASTFEDFVRLVGQDEEASSS